MRRANARMPRFHSVNQAKLRRCGAGFLGSSAHLKDFRITDIIGAGGMGTVRGLAAISRSRQRRTLEVIGRHGLAIKVVKEVGRCRAARGGSIWRRVRATRTVVRGGWEPLISGCAETSRSASRKFGGDLCGSCWACGLLSLVQCAACRFVSLSFLRAKIGTRVWEAQGEGSRDVGAIVMDKNQGYQRCRWGGAA